MTTRRVPFTAEEIAVLKDWLAKHRKEIVSKNEKSPCAVTELAIQ